MSNSVDRRIVEMKFDNKDFEDNVQTSVKSLDKLKKSLDLEESAKGLTALEKAGRKFSLNGIAEAAEAVTNKFSIMGTVGDQVLRRITDAALNAFNKMKNIVDSLTIQPIYTGFQEYETQINAVQTILSNTRDELSKKGYDDAGRLALVNEKLDQLNHYADKTIYNFTQMTESIGKFTAAGVDLETSVAAIQGIANLAAVSGSNAEQASNAMYMLSQAMSAGTIQLYHWNSVVRAGMGGELFQKSLIRTATAMGKTVDVTVEEVDKAGKKVRKTVKRTIQELVDEEGFRKSLEKGWLTTDILTTALDQFSWDFEQMANDTVLDDEKRETLIQRFAEKYIGEGDEADEALEKAKKIVSEMTGLTVEAVKELKMADLLASGYTYDEAQEIIRLAQDATEAATKVKTLTQLFDTLKEAAQSGWTQTWEYFIGDFDEAKSALTEVSKYFGKLIDDSANARNEIMKEWHDNGGRDMFWNNDEKKGPLGALWNFIYGIKNIIGVIKDEFRDLIPQITTQSLLSFTQRLQEITAKFKAWTENSEGINKVRRILAGVAAALDIVRTAAGYVWRGFTKLLGASEGLGDGVLEFVAKIGDWVVALRDSMKASEGFQQFVSRVGSVISSVRNVAVAAFSTVYGWITKIWTKVKGTGIITKIGKGISDFVSKIPSGISKVRKWVSGILDYIRASELLQTTWSKITKFFEPAVKAIENFGRRFRTALSNFFDKDVSGEETLLGRLRARLSAFTGPFADWFERVKTSASTAWTNIKDYLRTFFTETIPNFFNSKQINGSSIADKIKSVKWGEILKKVLGVAAIIEVIRLLRNFSKIGKIADAFKNLTKSVKSIAKNSASLTKEGLFINGKRNVIADNLLKIAGAIAILVGSVYVLAKMDGQSIMKGMGILSALAAEMLIISALFSKMQLDGGAILQAAAAILLLVIPIKMLSTMRTDMALKGILAVGVILAELALFTRLMGKDFDGKQAGFIGLGIAVNLLVIAIKSLSKLDAGSMGKSLTGMGVLLLELAAFSRIVSGAKISGMISMAIGLNLMVIALKQVGKMNSKVLIKGILGLGSVMLAFGTMIKLSKGVNFGNSLVILGMMAGSLMMVVHAFKEVEGSNMDDLLKFAGSISLLMTSMAVALKILSTLSFGAALAGLGKFALIIAGVGAIAAGLGVIRTKLGSEGVDNALTSGGAALEGIGRAIGKFVGGLTSGFVGSAIDLPQLGTDLSEFMKNADGFIKGAKSVDRSVIAGAGNLAGSIIAISGAEFFDAVVTWVSRSGLDLITKFSLDIAALGKGLGSYAEGIKPVGDVSTELLDHSVEVAGALADAVAKVPTKKRDIVGFSDGLGNLATGLVTFATTVSNVETGSYDKTKIDTVLAIATSLSELESNLEGQGGVEDFFAGIQSLSSFQGEFKPFAKGLNQFIEEIGQVEYDPDGEDATKMNAVIGLAQKLADLENSITRKNGIAQLFAGAKSLFQFSLGVPSFGANLTKFIEEIKLIDYDPNSDDAVKMDAVIELGKKLSDLESSLSRQNGLWQDIIGEKQLGAFGKEIPSFAKGLNEFIAEIRAITYESEKDSTKIDAMIELAKKLSELETNLEPQGGWADSILGSKDLSIFSNNIKLLGQGIASYMKDIQGVNPEKSEETIGALGVIQKFIDGFEKSGGLKQNWTEFFEGSQFNTLLTYTGSMRQMGDDLKSFSDSINDVKGRNFDVAQTIFGKMQEFINGLEDSGGFLDSISSWWNGTKFNTLSQIAFSMASFGINLQKFNDGVKGSDSTIVSQFENVKTLVRSFIDFAKVKFAFKYVTGTFGKISNVTFDDLNMIVEEMSGFGTKFSSFKEGISNADISDGQFEHVKTILNGIVTFASGLTTSDVSLTKDQMSNLFSVISDCGTYLRDFHRNLGDVPVDDLGVTANALSAIINALDVASSIPSYSAEPIQSILDNLSTIVFPEFDTEGMESARAFISGLTEGIEDAATILALTSAITTLSSEGSSAADGTYSVWYSSGQNLAEGLGAGIASMAQSVKNQAVSVAAGAINSIRMTWSVHSPSKVGEDLGMFFDLGLAGGLEAYSKVVSGQAADMGQNVVDSASTMLRGVDGSIFDNIDPNPTIRPVMDLTNVQNGVNAINNMFDSSNMSAIGLFRGMNLSRGINALHLDGGKITGTLTDKNIVARLESLQSKIEQLGEAVTNMQLVLDTGALVGGTSARMDNALGDIAMRKGRGN